MRGEKREGGRIDAVSEWQSACFFYSIVIFVFACLFCASIGFCLRDVVAGLLIFRLVCLLVSCLFLLVASNLMHGSKSREVRTLSQRLLASQNANAPNAVPIDKQQVRWE